MALSASTGPRRQLRGRPSEGVLLKPARPLRHL